jgi:5-formyltetrahydrofolate cyclo-ligase
VSEIASEEKVWRHARRKELIAARLAIPPALRTTAGRVVAGHLAALLDERRPAVAGFYWPIRGEFDPRPVMARFVAAGGTAALPVVVAPGEPMLYRAWHPASEMDEGRWGIPVPRAGASVTPELVLAPLVGFDARCYRLGYGGGFFDRTLAALRPRPFAVGVGFALARLPSVRPHAHDLPLDAIVTEAGVLRRP